MQKAKFILSKRKVLEQYNKIKDLASVVSYSSKTNQNVTKILEEETDSMFSVHMVDELKHIKDNSRVIFLAQGWSEEFILELILKRINYFVVDNENDLDILLSFLEKHEYKVNLFLRIKLKEMTVKTERYFVFGMNADIINKRIREIKSNEKILNLGVHFHRKTQNMSEWNLKYEISNILEEDVFKMLDMINIGGGIPSFYANTNFDVISKFE